jgi:hypothetical protein
VRRSLRPFGRTGVKEKLWLFLPRFAGCARMTLVLFRTRRRDECSRLKADVRHRVRKSRQKEAAGRRTRDLCKLNGASEGCRSPRESSRPVEEEPAHLCKDESMAEVSLGGDRKKMSGGNGDTLR